MGFPKLVLLPGMDGTGELFTHFVAAFPPGVETAIVSYPTDQIMFHDDLLKLVRSALPAEDFILIAESFSTPLAVCLAAEAPPFLRGVILCAAYCSAPLRGPRRWIAASLGSWMFHSTAPRWVIEWLLIGSDPPSGLIAEIQRAIAWVEPKVMAVRLHETLRCDVLHDLPAISVPLLAILPGHDRVVSSHCVEEMLAVRSVPTITIDGPHLLLQREPILCAEVIRRFLQESLPAVPPLNSTHE